MGLSFPFFTFMLLHLIVSHFTFTHPLCHDDELSALLQFKESLTINKSVSSDFCVYPKVASWKLEEEKTDCCSWDGVTCNKYTGHVIGLDVSSSCLYGSINSSSGLFQLVHLQWLSLADNDFNRSQIPSGIMNLSRLLHLDLSSSSFSGQIPAEILELSRLESLDLSYNWDDSSSLELLKPGLESLAEKLINLKVLILDHVKISSSVPHILANLSSLTHLSLEWCELQGEFPTKIFQLPNLHFLDVSTNFDLIGYLPEFEKSSPLEELILQWTRFSGEIPNSIGNIKSLSSLDISYSHFLGRNLFSLGNLSSLEQLDLSGCGDLGLNSHSLSWIAKNSMLTHLALDHMNLVGEIPSWLMNLTQLSELSIFRNKLIGSIPYWLMNLNRLTSLTLSSNQLTGSIPSEIKNLTHLETLDLSSNQLEDSIPRSIFKLKSLQRLILYSNNLSGIVDLNMFLVKLKSLSMLILSSNNLSLLTKTIVNTTQPQFSVLGFGSCNLSEFPNFLRNQDNLDGLDLSSNNIEGQIPGWLLNISVGSLSSLNLSYNFLIGFDQHFVVLPWMNLFDLDLRFNKLQGSLPVPSGSLLVYLVSNNQLIGEIPSWICGLNNLIALDLSYNKLSGVLPQCLGNFSYLSILELQSNKFHGSIPQTFMKGTELTMIDLSNNLLDGRIPRSLGNCTRLEFLNLGNNHITDIFPSWLGTLPRLKVLILRSNRFHGVINEAKSDLEFPELRIIDLSHNRFKGELPSKHFECWKAMKVVNGSQLTYMQYELLPGSFFTDFDLYAYSLTISNKGTKLNYGKISNFLTAIILSSNRFEGDIPTSIGNLKALHCLDLSNNNLQGHIPSSLGDLTELESLELSNNRLSGQIPQQLTQLTFLAFLNVSDNHLTGHIPQGKQFATFENNSFGGNLGLCGKPLSKRCEISEASQKEDPGLESPFELDWKIILIGYSTGLVIGLVLGCRFTTTKEDKFVKIFGWQLKIRTERKRRYRN